MTTQAPIISVTLMDGPLPAVSLHTGVDRDAACSVGAAVTFEGIVRALEGERSIAALVYEAYRPMADRTLERLAREAAITHSLSRVIVEHSVGRVAVGERSFRLTIDAPHRAQALVAMSEFIDQMKVDVPLWKTPEEHAGGVTNE